jgi:hypothetical protein
VYNIMLCQGVRPTVKTLGAMVTAMMKGKNILETKKFLRQHSRTIIPSKFPRTSADKPVDTSTAESQYKPWSLYSYDTCLTQAEFQALTCAYVVGLCDFSSQCTEPSHANHYLQRAQMELLNLENCNISPNMVSINAFLKALCSKGKRVYNITSVIVSDARCVTSYE